MLKCNLERFVRVYFIAHFINFNHDYDVMIAEKPKIKNKFKPPKSWFCMKANRIYIDY